MADIGNGNFPILNDIGKNRTGRYRHASDRPISACIGPAYIGVRQTGLYRRPSDRPISACTDPNRGQLQNADVQMKDKIKATLFDFNNLPNILKMLDKLTISVLF